MSIVRPLAGADGKTDARVTRECFAAAYQELFPPLYRYVRFRVGDATLAEDLVAATFERALHRLATIRQPERLRPWLFTIARRAIADHFRRQHSTADLASVDQRTDLLAPSPDLEGEVRQGSGGRGGGSAARAIMKLLSGFVMGGSACAIPRNGTNWRA